MFAGFGALSEARSTAGSKFSSSSCFGSSELALGGDDHGRGGKHDHSGEDQESGCARRRHDIVGELVECAVKAGMENRHE